MASKYGKKMFHYMTIKYVQIKSEYVKTELMTPIYGKYMCHNMTSKCQEQYVVKLWQNIWQDNLTEYTEECRKGYCLEVLENITPELAMAKQFQELILFQRVTLITDKSRQEPTRADKRHFIYYFTNLQLEKLFYRFLDIQYLPKIELWSRYIPNNEPTQ